MANSTMSSPSSQPESDDPYKLYNYHEYFLHPSEYAAQMSYLENPSLAHSNYGDSKHLTVPDKAVLVCHFPNSYVDPASPKFRQTRLVRIPREYHSYGDIVPQFSSFYPGREPGALHSLGWEARQRQAGGEAPVPNPENEERSWMTPVRHPLEQYMSPAELEYVVTTVNAILKDAFWPYSTLNILESLLQFITCFTAAYFIKLFVNIASKISTNSRVKHLHNNNNTLDNSGLFRTTPAASSQVINESEFEIPTISKYPSHTNWHLQKLEEFIRDTNAKLGGKIRFISPFRSAYLSLDIEIPSPIPLEQYEE